MSNAIWKLAEHADWFGWWPTPFWRWLLAREDRKHGYVAPTQKGGE